VVVLIASPASINTLLYIDYSGYCLCYHNRQHRGRLHQHYILVLIIAIVVVIISSMTKLPSRLTLHALPGIVQLFIELEDEMLHSRYI
jgi:hypothetical protein